MLATLAVPLCLMLVFLPRLSAAHSRVRVEDHSVTPAVFEDLIWVMPPFASQRATGLYRLDDPVATLRNMPRAHDASARQISPWLLGLAQ